MLPKTCEISTKIEVLPGNLTVTGPPIGRTESTSNAMACGRFYEDNSRRRDEEFWLHDSTSLLKTQSQINKDSIEDVDFSEDESLCSDSDMAHDPMPNQADSERYIEEMITQHVQEHKESFLSFLDNPQSLPGVRYCPTDGRSGSRRQGSPIHGPPPKRRSNSSRKAVQGGEGSGNDDNDEGNDEGDPSERRGRHSRVGSNGSLLSKIFACPYRKYEPSRDYGGHDCDAGWAQFHRLK